MPTLDDLPTLAKNVAIAANDSIAISNKDLGGGSRIQQVPAALAVEGFTHAWVINYDNTTLDADSSGDAQISLYTFTSDQFLKKARVMCTEVFTSSGSMSALSIDLGASGHDGGTDDDNFVDDFSAVAIGSEENTGGDLASSLAGLATEPAGTLQLTVTPTGVACNTFTAGQLVILAAITSISDYKDIVPPT